MIVVYYIIIPITWKFFLSFEINEVSGGLPIKLEAKISEYFDLILEMILGFGLAFQLPLILALLSSIGIISYKYLQKFRKYGIVIIFIISAILTPPDVLSQIILALPLMLLYEISIFVCKKIETGRKSDA